MNQAVNPRSWVLKRLLSDDVSTDLTVVPEFSKEDLGFVTELLKGSCREWFWIASVLRQFVKKPPRKKAEAILVLSAYQILFMDRTPKHAVFSEMKALAREHRLNEAEARFCHGVLERVWENRESLLNKRSEILKEASLGHSIDQKEALSVFNLPIEVVSDVIRAATKLDEQSGRAWMALAAMKSPAALVGYFLPDHYKKENLTEGVVPLESTSAPRAVHFQDAVRMQYLLQEKKIVVQGEGSQWACEAIGHFIRSKIHRGASEYSVTEIGAGKGGKTLGTLTGIRMLNANYLPKIRWTAVESDPAQAEYFKKDVEPLLKTMSIPVEYRVWNALAGLPEDLTEQDMIWIDAPCSGLATLGKHPEIAFRVTPEKMQGLAKKQREMLHAVKNQVRDGGYLVLSLCTLSATECVDSVAQFLKEAEEFEMVAQKILWPGSQEVETNDGFFIVVFQRFKAA